MQKVQSYLYPNRVILLADLAGFTVENKVAYARRLKIYSGIDNVIQFDIQNADQKRIDLTTLQDIEVNIMDASGKALKNSPYQPTLTTSATATGVTVNATNGKSTTTTLTVPTANIAGAGFAVSYTISGTSIVGPVVVSSISSDVDSGTTTLTVTFPNQTVTSATGVSISNIIKGLAQITIPLDDLNELDDQYLSYSVTAVDQFGNNILLYADSNFTGAGKIELLGDAMPVFRDDRVYDEFVGEINFMGNVTQQTPAIPCSFYEAEPTEYMSFDIYLNNFIGTIWVEGTEDMTIAQSSWSNAPQFQTFSCTTATTTTVSFNNVSVASTAGHYNYMRIRWQYPDVWQYGSQQDPTTVYGSITKVVASSN